MASPPAISSTTALLCALVFTIAYIAPFYLSATLRTTPLLHRDDPTVIRARVRAVLLTCTACTLFTTLLLTQYVHLPILTTLHHLGLFPTDLTSPLNAVLLCAILFVGPLYEQLLINAQWRTWSLAALKLSLWDDWTGYRNIIVAPISEELVFRSLIISLYLQTDTSPTRIVFTTPLIFGVAHVHHLVDFLRSRTPPGRTLPDGTAWVQGIVRSLVQFTYTSLFGFFAAFVYLRTGSLWAVIGTHMFCNWQGVPRVSGRVGQDHVHEPPTSDITPDVAQGRGDRTDNTPKSTLPQHLGIEWTVVYYALLFVGMFGFYTMLWPLTESPNALATF